MHFLGIRSCRGASAAKRATRTRESAQRVSSFNIQSEFSVGVADETVGRYAYGARSEAAVYVGDVLREEVPALAARDLEIVAIARRPGVLSKVAIRSGQTVAIRSGQTVASPLVVGIGADQVAAVRARLDGERIEIIAWRRSAPAYIADALGLGVNTVPPMVLLPGIRHARVLLGEIDVRGIAGWRGLNTALASALTGWRIRLEPVTVTPAWKRLEVAMQTRRAVQATVVGQTDRGMRVEVLGLYATLNRASRVGQNVLNVRVIRMDPDEGRIFVSDRLAATGQLPLV
jgi:transcription antitermination factor NusA-like protein